MRFLFGEEVTASALAEVPEGRLAGIVSAKGSRTSHVAILSRALKIPTVMGAKGIYFDKMDKNKVIVDGYLGKIYINPTKTHLSEFTILADEERELDANLEKLRDEPAETMDGHRIKLCVNTGFSVDAGFTS